MGVKGSWIEYKGQKFTAMTEPWRLNIGGSKMLSVVTWRAMCNHPGCNREFDYNYNANWPVSQGGAVRTCEEHRRGAAASPASSASVPPVASPAFTPPPAPAAEPVDQRNQHPPIMQTWLKEEMAANGGKLLPATYGKVPRLPSHEVSIAELDALAEAELGAPVSSPARSTGMKPDEIEFCVKMLCAAMRAHNIPRSIPTLIEQVAMYAADTQNAYWARLNALLDSRVERYAEIIGHMIQRKFVDLVDGDKTQMDPAHREYMATVLTDEGHEHAEAYSRRVFRPDEKTATLEPVAFASSAPAASGPAPMHMRPEFAAGNTATATVESATAAARFKGAIKDLPPAEFRAAAPPGDPLAGIETLTLNYRVWRELYAKGHGRDE